MYRISKTFKFSASHQLLHLPDGHKCKRMHGHNYSITLTFQREDLDSDYFVRDFATMDDFSDWIKTALDHRHLNDVMTERNRDTFDKSQRIKLQPFEPLPPTCEVMARWIFGMWKMVYLDLYSVRVSESDSTYGEYFV